jgi:hypothetical protein
MPYAITEKSWRGIEEGWPLQEGEFYVEDIPLELIEKVEQIDVERSSRALLERRLAETSQVIAPLQAGVDIDEISDEDRLRWRSWKRYLIALSNTTERPGWPEAPDWPTIPAWPTIT